jgi:hypothetical protein
LTSVSIVAEGIAERGPLTITGISFTGISGLSEIPLSASFPLFGAPAMSLGAASGLLGDSDMETIKSLVALGIVLLPALAFAQGVAQRPGTVRVIPSGFEDHATAKDFGGWIAWRSNHNGNKTQFVPVCNATANGAVLTIIDGQGNSSTHPIDVKVPNDGGNVGQSPNGFSINYNNGSAQIVCDGNNNWMIVSEYAPGGLPPRVVHANQITTFTNSWLTCSDATSCAPYVNNPDYLCDAAQNPSQCALETFEDTLRPSDANRMVVYDAPRNVDLALPRSTPHTGFRPGWSTIVVNRGQGNVTVHVDFRLSRINGGTAPFIIPQGGSAMITAEGDENYIAVEFGGGHTPVPSGSDDRK